MKKLMYIAAALLVLVGCNKKDNNNPEGTPFKKGQQVTLTVGTGDNANQAASRKVAGTDNTTNNRIDFTWEAGDKILVKVGDATAEFTLSSEPGLAQGDFGGTMPADGSTFDIQYPIEEPDLSTQEYTEEKTIPADKMLFTATNCTLGTNHILYAQNAMVQLNLYGTDTLLSKIVFKNITASPAESYTLICTGGVKIGDASTDATPFYMVVPAGEYQFEFEVWDNAATPINLCSYATSTTKTFAANKCLNMPAKFVPTYVDLGLDVLWASCNVGATIPEGDGDYFAWGETEPYYNTPIADPITWKTGKTEGYTWLSYCGQYEFIEWTTPPYDATTKILKPEYDAATANWGSDWRMPTKDEITELLYDCDKEWTTDYNGTGVAGYIFKSKAKGNNNSIFLPASGFRINTSLDNVGSYGYYWSSLLHEYDLSGAHYLLFNLDNADWSVGRYGGQSVRPVCKIPLQP